jgi:hypothetical protein
LFAKEDFFFFLKQNMRNRGKKADNKVLDPFSLHFSKRQKKIIRGDPINGREKGHVSIPLRTENCEQINKDDQKIYSLLSTIIYYGEDDILFSSGSCGGGEGMPESTHRQAGALTTYSYANIHCIYNNSRVLLT